MQQDVDGVAALCSFMVAACRAAWPTVPCVCFFVVPCHLVPAICWQLILSAGAPKIPSSPRKTGGNKVCGHTGPCATISQGLCLLFLSQRVSPFSLWFFEDSKTSLLFSVPKKGHVCKINNPKIMRGSWTDLKRPHLE